MQLRQFSAIGILFADLSLALRGPRCPLHDSVVVGICNYVITMSINLNILWRVHIITTATLQFVGFVMLSTD